MLGIESRVLPAARIDKFLDTHHPARHHQRDDHGGGNYIIVSSGGAGSYCSGSGNWVLRAHRLPCCWNALAPPGSGRWLALFVVISGLGALNGWTLLVGELTRTMASSGVLPAVLARNNRHGAPVAALVVTGVLASVMIWMSHSQSLVAAFTFLTLVVTAANLPAYLGCALALLVLWRRRLPTCTSHTALLAASTGIVFVIFVFVGTGREPFLYALGLCAAGLPLYALMRLRRKTAPPVEVIPE